MNSVGRRCISTVLCLLIGYPMAYGIARSPTPARSMLLMLVILPFWTSFLMRVYAWIGILKNNGLINNVLIWLGVIDEPIPMMNTDFAVYHRHRLFLSALHDPAALCRTWRRWTGAARGGGGSRLPALAGVLHDHVPLSMPGIIAGSMLVFIPAVGEYVIPELLGGPDSADDRRACSATSSSATATGPWPRPWRSPC